MGTKGELLEAARFFFAGRLQPVIDRVYALRDAAAAQERLETSGQFGKVVLSID
jgi:NADPH:quinone reductase-like Zn-dependent oxidoreductase